jgi:urease beta subunit
MAIGRISGQLLKDNLLRDGVNLRFENDLIYLLVSPEDGTAHKVGIKTANPSYTLDVNGTTRSTHILGTDAEIGDIYLENNIIKSVIGDLYLRGATPIDKIKIDNDVLINGNLHATGAITADGDLTLGDANTDNIVFNADINSNVLPNITDRYDLGSADKRWRSTFQQKMYVGDISIENDTISNFRTNGDVVLSANGLGIIELTSYTKLDSDLEVLGNIKLGTNGQGQSTLDTVTSTVNLVNNTATTVNFAGGATDIQIGSSTGTTNVNNNLDIDGDVNIDGGDLTVSTAVFNLANNNATTINFAGAATDIQIGSSEGITNVNNNLDVDGDVNIDGGDLTVSTSVFNLANETATTVNFAGDATNVQIGSSEGITNVNNNLDVDGDVNIDGGDLTVSTSVFNLANEIATTVNFAGDATNVQIGSDAGDTNVNNNLTVDGVTNVQKELTVEGDTTVNSRLTVEGIVDVNNSLYVTGSTDVSESLNVQGSTSVQRELVVEGDTQINKSLAVEGELKAGKLVDTVIDCGEY